MLDKKVKLYENRVTLIMLLIRSSANQYNLGGIQKGYSIFGWAGRCSKIRYNYAKAIIKLKNYIEFPFCCTKMSILLPFQTKEFISLQLLNTFVEVKYHSRTFYT